MRQKINNNEPRLFDIDKPGKLLTYVTLSEWLSVPVSTLQKWVHADKIPFRKVGRHVRFRQDEIASHFNLE